MARTTSNKGGNNAYGKNGLKGDPKGANGKEGRKRKGDWHGFCSYCGKKGHSPKDCWTKQRDEANNPSKMQISNVDEQDVSGFDIGCVFLSKQKPAQKVKTVEVKNSFEALEENEKEICSVDDERKRGRITVDSGAAESVWPQDLLPEVETKPSHGSKNGVTYVAANGSRMPNMGEKKVRFKTTDGLNSSIMFQVTKVKKPLAAVSKITEKGNWVCFGPSEAYIHNIETGMRTKMDLINGTYSIDVEYDSVFSGQGR